jgi:hypothetical protein
MRFIHCAVPTLASIVEDVVNLRSVSDNLIGLLILLSIRITLLMLMMLLIENNDLIVVVIVLLLIK